MSAKALILTQDNALRGAALQWAKPDDVEFLFYEDPAEALAMARKQPLRLFLADVRGPHRVGEGVLRRLHALPGAPEILLVAEAGADDSVLGALVPPTPHLLAGLGGTEF